MAPRTEAQKAADARLADPEFAKRVLEGHVTQRIAAVARFMQNARSAKVYPNEFRGVDFNTGNVRLYADDNTTVLVVFDNHGCVEHQIRFDEGTPSAAVRAAVLASYDEATR